MIKLLANLFRGLHLIIGITALPPDATPAQERNFVLMWVGIIAAVIAWCAFLVYLVS
ncbi:MAG TPA: hypothetical protein VJQ56_07510 [Blastocatellia bacterium]|nr:hypothetical protein [Blastocatellia bacterium]